MPDAPQILKALSRRKRSSLGLDCRRLPAAAGRVEQFLDMASTSPGKHASTRMGWIRNQLISLTSSEFTRSSCPAAPDTVVLVKEHDGADARLQRARVVLPLEDTAMQRHVVPVPHNPFA
eukprot:5723877-Pleurochrysis_carterae.AAC.8